MKVTGHLLSISVTMKFNYISDSSMLIFGSSKEISFGIQILTWHIVNNLLIGCLHYVRIRGDISNLLRLTNLVAVDFYGT